MNTIFKTSTLIMLTALTISACANEPKPERDPFNQADSQRNRASQTQGELSSETLKK